MYKLKLLIVGPQPNPITGNSLANKIVLDYMEKYHDNSIVGYIDTSYNVLKEDLGVFSFKKFFHYFKQYKNLSKIKDYDKIYLTIGQTFFGVIKYYPYILISKILKKEIILHIHGNHLLNEYNSLSGIKKNIFYKIISDADKGIVLSESLKNNLEPFLLPTKIFILENFVEDFLFEDVYNKKLESLKIIYLSNLMEEKGIFDLLEGLLILKEKNIPFEAKIAGGIDEKNKLIIQGYLEKLINEVDYLGLVYGNEKKNLLKWGNVFVFPTYYKIEGQPISILEAMATGNIILTTNHSGIPDIFQDKKNGFFIEKKSPKSIAKQLLHLNESLKDYTYISKENILEAYEKYKVKNFINKLYDILNEGQ